MKRRKPTKDRADFYAGIITALGVIRGADEGTLWREIVELCDVDELIQHARDNDEYEFAGFDHFAEEVKRIKERN